MKLDDMTKPELILMIYELQQFFDGNFLDVEDIIRATGMQTDEALAICKQINALRQLTW